MKDVFVGTYELGYERIRLYLRAGGGANCYFIPDDKDLPMMVIGADQEKWRHIVGSMLHESQEYAMCRLNKSYYPHGALNNGSSNCLFVLSHEQFDECSMRAGDFIAGAYDDLFKAWNKWNAAKKKRGK